MTFAAGHACVFAHEDEVSPRVIEIRSRRPSILTVAILAARANDVIVPVFVTMCARLGQATIRLSATLRGLFQDLRIGNVLLCMASTAFGRGVLSSSNEARQAMVERFCVERRKEMISPRMFPVAGDTLLSGDFEMIPTPLGEGGLNLFMAEKALLSRDFGRNVVALKAVLHSGEVLVGDRQFTRGKLGRRDIGRASPDKCRDRYAVKSHNEETLEPRISTNSFEVETSVTNL
jgi:hypothetical protein